MNKLLSFLVLLLSISMLFLAGCSDKDSTEACQYETTMNLDKGNYDAVLSSSCADSMQRGAAYFGKAGFDIKDVVNRFSEAKGVQQTDTLNFYMTALIGRVTDGTLTFLDDAKSEYKQADPVYYLDAQFYISLVDSVKSLSLIKLAISNLSSSCDINGNGVPDDADATACALIASSKINNSTSDGICTGGTGTFATYVPISPSDINLTTTNPVTQITGTFSGLTITINGSAAPPCGTDYKRLLYTVDNTDYYLATTTSDLCTNSTNTSDTWPCPLSGQNRDFVSTMDTSLTEAINSLNVAIPPVTGTDVQQSINDIKGQNCCTDLGEVWDPNNPNSCQCSSQEIANYLLTL